MLNLYMRNKPLIALINFSLLVATMQQAVAGDNTAENEWQFAAEAYAWGPDISGTSTTGGNFDIPLHEIIDNLEMTIMGRIGAKKDKLTLFSDIIYLDLSTDEKGSFNIPIGRGPGLTVGDKLDIGLKAWVVQPTAAYTVFETSKYNIDLLAGARYLWIEVDLALRTTGPFANRKVKDKESEHNWDGIVGASGRVALNDKWDATVYADAGSGDSDYTLQGQAALSYKFDSFEGRFGYRYLKWEFDGHGALEDLTIKGPFAGALFRF